jgi:sulfite exporter TauE/SafE
MKAWAASLHAVLLTIWAGTLWTVGWVPLVLFGRLQEIAAGNIAARLFEIGAWVGMVCGGLLIALRLRATPQRPKRDWILWGLVVMLLITLVSYFGIGAIMENLRQQAAPLSIRDSPLRAQFGMWHGVSSTLFLIEGLIALALVACPPKRAAQ